MIALVKITAYDDTKECIFPLIIVLLLNMNLGYSLNVACRHSVMRFLKIQSEHIHYPIKYFNEFSVGNGEIIDMLLRYKFLPS